MVLTFIAGVCGLGKSFTKADSLRKFTDLGGPEPSYNSGMCWDY